jgi:SAM-dependent methyltransferase
MVDRDYAPYVSPSLLPVAATLLALAGIRTGEVVVDVGCGAGLLTHPAAAAASSGRVYGVDSSAASLVAARSRRPSPVLWVRAAPGRLPFGSGTVDKVLAGSLHAVADAPGVVAECARVLVPGGRLVVGAWVSVGSSPVSLGGAGGAGVASVARAVGLRVAHESSEEVSVPFATAESYAAWLASFAAAPAPVDGATLATGVVHYLTATPA